MVYSGIISMKKRAMERLYELWKESPGFSRGRGSIRPACGPIRTCADIRVVFQTAPEHNQRICSIFVRDTTAPNQDGRRNSIMTRDEILRTLEDEGEDWVVAAMIEGSIGYHSPGQARRLIKNMRDGETQDWCERCVACFKGDLLGMLKHDIDGFRRVSRVKVTRLVKAVPQLGTMNSAQQMAFSLMYPTVGV